MPPVAARITKLEATPDGDYSISVDGIVLGDISAHPKASFVIYPKGKEVYQKEYGIHKKDPVNIKKPDTITLEAGTHNIEWLARKLKIEVKDLKLSFQYVGPDNVRILKDGTRDESKNEAAEKQNEKARAELLGRVVVTEA